jgi:hypothetical protein
MHCCALCTPLLVLVPLSHYTTLQQAVHSIDEIVTTVPQGHDKAATAAGADTTTTHIRSVQPVC